MSSPLVETCPHCDGRGRSVADDPDADGGRVVVDCEFCACKGEVVLCLEPLCGEVMSHDEAEKHGAFCEACRRSLDASDAEVEARRLRWSA